MTFSVETAGLSAVLLMVGSVGNMRLFVGRPLADFVWPVVAAGLTDPNMAEDKPCAVPTLDGGFVSVLLCALVVGVGFTDPKMEEESACAVLLPVTLTAGLAAVIA